MDVSMAAAWRQARVSHVQFVARSVTAGHELPSIFSIPGFRIDQLCVDVLHACDLGVTQDAVGSFFYEYVRAQGNNAIKRRLLLLNRQLRVYYREQQQNGKKLSQVDVVTSLTIQAKKKPPSLNGCKGAETRHLVPFALQLAKQMVDDAPQQRKAHWSKRENMLQALDGFYASTIMEPYDPVITAKCSQAFAVAFMALHRSYRAGGGGRRLPYHVRPKMHMLQELSTQCFRFGSPREFWAYQDESYLMRVKRIAVKSPHPTRMEFNIVARLRLLDEFGAAAE